MRRVGGEEIPYIVIIVGELAELMELSGSDVEKLIAKLQIVRGV